MELVEPSSYHRLGIPRAVRWVEGRMLSDRRPEMCMDKGRPGAGDTIRSGRPGNNISQADVQITRQSKKRGHGRKLILVIRF